MPGHEYEQNPELNVIGNAYPFIFDPQRKLFVIGNQVIDSRVDEKEFLEKIIDNQEDRDIGFEENIPLVLESWFKLTQLPVFRKWISELTENEKQIVGTNVNNVIMERFIQSAPKKSITMFKKAFKKGLYIPRFYSETGKFHLNTVGNCACLGTPHPQLEFPDEYFEDPSKPVYYLPHNADTSDQFMSLYAGAGTLAWSYINDFKTPLEIHTK